MNPGPAAGPGGRAVAGKVPVHRYIHPERLVLGIGDADLHPVRRLPQQQQAWLIDADVPAGAAGKLTGLVERVMIVARCVWGLPVK
ncbi:MAG TPA: hypothetical protein VFJ58_17570 [Armatimonadota bacterium]|nr:hypothetical protein [Armatimonadota bacterium]